MAQPQPNLDLSNTNTCSFSSKCEKFVPSRLGCNSSTQIFHHRRKMSTGYFTPHCKGLNFVMTTAADGKTSTLETYGYNSRTKNLVRFEHKLMLDDDNYLVYQSPEITKMEYISSKGNVEPVAVTEAVKMSQGVPFAIIALEPTLKYAVFQSCDLKTAWVAFSEELVNSQPDIAVLDVYEQEIEKTLYQNGIDVSTMVDIDFSFHELNNLVMGTNNARSSVVGMSMTDIEQELLKLFCKMVM